MRSALGSSLTALGSTSRSGAPSTSRLLSSTSSSSFLFRRPAGPNVTTLIKELAQAREDDRLDVVRRVYPSLLTAVHALPPGSPSPVSRHRLRTLMRFAADAGSFSLVLKMFNSLERTFGYPPEPLDHHILLLAMARAGKLGKALSWIEGMHRTHGIYPTVADWNVVLNGYRRARDLEGLRFAWGRLLASGLKRSTPSYNTLLAGLFELGSLADVQDALDQMKDAQISPDLTTETTLLTGFVQAGDLVSARAVAKRLRDSVDLAGEDKAGVGTEPELTAASVRADEAVLNALIQFECAESGSIDAGLRLASEFAERGCSFNQRTLNTLAVPGAAKLTTAEEGISLIDSLEKVTGQASDRRTWTIVLKGVLSNGGINEALAVHQEARDRSVLPDSQMVQPLLSELLPGGKNTPAQMAKAKELYEDLATASKTHSVAPDASVYNTLLRACADPDYPDIGFSSTLMADMRERDVKLEPQSVTWHIVALMRAASSHEDAFKIYDEMRALDVSALNHSSYNTILAAFTEVQPDSPAPPQLVLEFLSDMRKTANPPSNTTYSLLLNYYSTGYRSAASIAQLHSLIKLDLNLDPDTALFNTLMSAYSRVGAFNASYRVWDTMRANPHAGAAINDHSISIVLDTCGFEGGENGLARAFEVWKELEREGRIRNLKHYDSFIECLARFGEMDRAEELALGSMSPQRAQKETHGVVAGVSTLSTLLKFARRYEGRWDRLRKRIEAERPDLWPQLRDVAKYDQ